MENVFEVPQTEAPQKKPRKKRVMSEEQKKAFVARMRKSREEKKAKKASPPPKQPITESNNIQTEISQEVEAPPKKVIKDRPVQSEIRQPTIDYSHFNNLTSNIQLLNDTLLKLANPPPQPKQEPPSQPKQIVENKPVEIEPEHIDKAKEIKEVYDEPIKATKPEKKKVWNCRRKCFVYM